MADAEVQKFWERHQRWSGLADRLKKNVQRARFWTLCLGIAGAVLQTLAVEIAPAKASDSKSLATACAISGTAALALVAIVAAQFLKPAAVTKWLRARSASEGLKSAVYRYLAGGLPYAGAGRAEAFAKDCEDIDSYFKEVSTDLAEVTLDNPRPLPEITNGVSYIAERVKPQREQYYLKKAKQNATRARQFRTLELGISIFAAALGAIVSGMHISTTDPKGLGAWIAVITTVGAAIAAHATANRYAEQAQIFYATAYELENAVTAYNNSADPAAMTAQFVGRCEDAISTENKGWMVKIRPDA